MNTNRPLSEGESEIVRRLADGEDPWVVDPEYGCTNPLTGYFPTAEVAAERARRREASRISDRVVLAEAVGRDLALTAEEIENWVLPVLGSVDRLTGTDAP